MCFQVYLGADVACPEIPYKQRPDHRETDLYVGRCSEVAGLSKPYQYHLGILSCGCGFAEGISAADDEWTLGNHIQLADYVADCLRKATPIELFSCWLGDEAAPLKDQRRITLEQLREPEFSFEPRQLIRVYKDEAAMRADQKMTA